RGSRDLLHARQGAPPYFHAVPHHALSVQRPAPLARRSAVRPAGPSRFAGGSAPRTNRQLRGRDYGPSRPGESADAFSRGLSDGTAQAAGRSVAGGQRLPQQGEPDASGDG